jgi:DNA gyrase subunit A
MPIINLEGVQVEAGERVLAVITLPDFESGHNLVMATVAGMIKKTPIERFERVRSTGIRAITVNEGDALAWVAVSSGADDIVLATAQGRLARFSEREVRPMGRDATGVIGIRLARRDDRVVGMGVVAPGADILVLTETGYGKRVALSDFRSKHRGSQGVRLISLEGSKSGGVAAVELVTERDEELLLISSGGQVVRTDVQSINRYGSAARGVIVMRLNPGDSVAGIAVFRQGLAEGRTMGENPANGPGEDGPDDGAAGS